MVISIALLPQGIHNLDHYKESRWSCFFLFQLGKADVYSQEWKNLRNSPRIKYLPQLLPEIWDSFRKRKHLLSVDKPSEASSHGKSFVLWESCLWGENFDGLKKKKVCIKETFTGESNTRKWKLVFPKFEIDENVWLFSFPFIMDV